MPTDNERLEIAARLRKCTPTTSYGQAQGGGWSHLCDMALAVGLKREDEPTAWELAQRLADLIEPDDPPYNLYTLYEAVFHRSPRCWECLEDDEVDELVDAMLDIFNMPGHEHIQRSGPAHPDATASYKGWRAEVYDPDGVLASPSNVAADLVRAHADGKRPSEPKVRCVAEVKVDGERLEQLVHDAVVEVTGIDRDALLVEVKELEKCARYFGLDFDEDEPLRDRLKEASEDFAGSAHRIRKALGVADEN